MTPGVVWLLAPSKINEVGAGSEDDTPVPKNCIYVL